MLLARISRIIRSRAVLSAALSIWLVAFLIDTAWADGWMFRRSYFSHAPLRGEASPYALPESRSAYRHAWAGTSPGIAVRGGYRYNTTFLRSGNSVDVTVQREHWFEINPYGRP